MSLAKTAYTIPVGRLAMRAADQTRPRASILLESRSPKFRRALALLEKFAKHERVNVLLVGDSGTGKSAFARHLHDRSPRAGQVFHQVVLSAISDGLTSSDLFGHVQGAFTDAHAPRAGRFASASGGTLFLDEIGKASAVVQHSLLDAVERREFTPVGADRSVRVDVRIVAATNVELRDLVDEGTFLPDLRQRLDVFTVRLPTLRERREDIHDLVEHLVDWHAPELGYRRPPRIDPDLMGR